MDEERLLAIHEAAHAVLARALHLQFTMITLKKDEDSFASVVLKPFVGKISSREVFTYLLMVLAGPLAQWMAQGGGELYIATSSGSDCEMARKYYMCLSDDDPEEGLQKLMLESLLPMLHRAWPIIKDLATALLEDETIGEKEALQIMDESARTHGLG
jgi:hypothetical protein